MKSKHSNQLVIEIREYIEVNDGDSSLPLTHISDKFKGERQNDVTVRRDRGNAEMARRETGDAA